MSANADFLPYGRHWIDEDDIAAVVDILRGDWLTQGPKVSEFEEKVAADCGARYAVACNSGTSALHLALLAGGVGEMAGGRRSDESIAPATTFLATGNCALYAGATPRFTDVEFGSVNMTEELLEPLLSNNTRAVLPVHFGGLPADMPAISSLVRERCPKAVIIEDACHAPGARHKNGKPVGSLQYSDMVMFSFHPVKHVAAGEAGMILTDSDTLAEKLRSLRTHGMTKSPEILEKPDEGPWYYEMHELGYNFRLPDMNCALGLSQWSKMPQFLSRRREIARQYHTAFKALEEEGLLIRPLPGLPTGEEETPTIENQRNAWHIYFVRIPFDKIGKNRKQVVQELRDRGVGTQVHYYPVPLQPYYKNLFGYKPGQFEAAEKHYNQTLTIPLYPKMSDSDVQRVIDSIAEVLRKE